MVMVKVVSELCIMYIGKGYSMIVNFDFMQ